MPLLIETYTKQLLEEKKKAKAGKLVKQRSSDSQAGAMNREITLTQLLKTVLERIVAAGDKAFFADPKSSYSHCVSSLVKLAEHFVKRSVKACMAEEARTAAELKRKANPLEEMIHVTLRSAGKGTPMKEDDEGEEEQLALQLTSNPVCFNALLDLVCQFEHAALHHGREGEQKKAHYLIQTVGALQSHLEDLKEQVARKKTRESLYRRHAGPLVDAYSNTLHLYLPLYQ